MIVKDLLRFIGLHGKKEKKMIDFKRPIQSGWHFRLYWVAQRRRQHIQRNSLWQRLVLSQNYPIIYGVLGWNGYCIKWPTEASRIHLTSFLGAKLIELQKSWYWMIAVICQSLKRRHRHFSKIRNGTWLPMLNKRMKIPNEKECKDTKCKNTKWKCIQQYRMETWSS
jgi:hypothetical protein